jgi:hypothetical protein
MRRLSPGGKKAGVQNHLVLKLLKLRMDGARPRLFPVLFKAWCLITHRDNFIIAFTVYKIIL